MRTGANARITGSSKTAPPPRDIREAGALKYTKPLRLPAPFVPVIYTLLLTVFFFPVLFFNDKAFPWDIVTYHYPVQYFISRWIHAGVFPLWDPHITLGYPVVGDIVAGSLYPPTLLSFFTPWSNPLRFKVVEVVLILHILLAGWGMYYLCRRLNLAQPAALLAGVVFMFGGFFPMHVEHEAWVKAISWTPLILALYMDLMNTPGVRRAITVAGAFAMVLLAGGPSVFLHIGYLLGAWTIWQVSAQMRNKQIHAGMISFAALIGVGALAAGIAMIQLLPGAELAQNSTRKHLTFEESADGSMGATTIVTSLVPGIYGYSKPTDLSDKVGDPSLIHVYCGWTTLILAFVGATAPSRCPGTKWFFLAITSVAILLSFGSATPFYHLAYLFAPGFSMFRRPVGFFAYAVLAISVLAAIGVDAILERRLRNTTSRTFWWISGPALAVVAVVLALKLTFDSLPTVATGPYLFERLGTSAVAAAAAMLICVAGCLRFVKPAIWGIAVVLFSFVDLWFFNANQVFNNATGNVEQILSRDYIFEAKMPATVIAAGENPGTARIGVAAFGGVFDNAANVLGFESWGGYNPLRTTWYTSLLGAVDSQNSPIFDLANVRYVLTTTAFREPSQNQIAPLNPVAYQIRFPGGPLEGPKYILVDSVTHDWYQVFENRTVLPRFFAVSNYTVENGGKAFGMLRSGAIDFRRTIVLDRSAGKLGAGCESAEIHLHRYTPNAILLDVASPSTCLVFAGDGWYPGWQVRIDGRESTLFRADGAFRAFVTPPGSHQVEMCFAPLSFRVGLAGTFATVLLCTVLWIWNPRTKTANAAVS